MPFEPMEEMEDLDATGLAPMPTVPDGPGESTVGQSARQASASDSGGQGSTGASRTEDPRDKDQAKEESRAPAMLPDIRGGQQSAIASADIKFYLAAANNTVLNELQIMCQQENIPPALRDRPDLLLRLCADYGIDEENDAEARDYLEHIRNGSSGHQKTDDPLFRFRQEALNDFGRDKSVESFKAYKAAVEAAYDVEFTDESGDEWKLADIVMAHAALEMAASVFGNRLRDLSGINIDDAAAFQLIFAPLTIFLSQDVSDNGAFAKVGGSNIKVFWYEYKGRNYNLHPFLLLHELGHRLNTVAGFGKVWGPRSINMHPAHPNTRAGMGESAQRPLHLVIGVDEHHGMYGEADVDAKHVEMLQYGEQTDHNEVTADGILNWLARQITGGESG